MTDRTNQTTVDDQEPPEPPWTLTVVPVIHVAPGERITIVTRETVLVCSVISVRPSNTIQVQEETHIDRS